MEQSFWSPDFQVSKISNPKYDILNVYYKNKSENEFLFCLNSLIVDFTKTIVVGDFNINYKEREKSRILRWLLSKKMVQMVEKSTHILGGLIDQVWVSENLRQEMNISQKSVYFSDHDLLVLTINR